MLIWADYLSLLPPTPTLYLSPTAEMKKKIEKDLKKLKKTKLVVETSTCTAQFNQ